ncbi:macro domain-containing protein [Aliiroseovarius crassostreae]|uniref:macro domain-containing protein n=1 Tax=Aliiroseovarius crassostreae TaxID=154981 RepID=UPI002205F0F5|nr:macro domain-containing protein [Aliiroseovarius crassostreae]UWP97485.1 macro domain-containing protein [Aliiroseovarius crassostreae]
MKTVKGDLVKMALQGEFDVIVHGCNCFHTMGAGIAKTISTQFPEAFAADKATVYADKNKLGTISHASIRRESSEFVIVNAYTQFQWKGRGRKADYTAIGSCFREIAKEFGSRRIGYPLIGAGLAGGNWTEIEPMIETELEGCDHTLVIFAP